MSDSVGNHAGSPLTRQRRSQDRINHIGGHEVQPPPRVCDGIGRDIGTPRMPRRLPIEIGVYWIRDLSERCRRSGNDHQAKENRPSSKHIHFPPFIKLESQKVPQPASRAKVTILLIAAAQPSVKESPASRPPWIELHAANARNARESPSPEVQAEQMDEPQATATASDFEIEQQALRLLQNNTPLLSPSRAPQAVPPSRSTPPVVPPGSLTDLAQPAPRPPMKTRMRATQ